MTRFTPAHLVALLTLLAASTTGCGEPASGPQPLAEPACVALADALSHGDDWRVGLLPLDPAPRPSVAKPGATIRLWVTADALAVYRALAVDALRPADGQRFPRGGAVVREIFDADGARIAITATCRAQAGYNPDVGDLWFAHRPVGATASDPAGGAIETGRIPSCNGCHTYNDATAGLYGPLMPQ